MNQVKETSQHNIQNAIDNLWRMRIRKTAFIQLLDTSIIDSYVQPVLQFDIMTNAQNCGVYDQLDWTHIEHVETLYNNRTIQYELRSKRID